MLSPPTLPYRAPYNTLIDPFKELFKEPLIDPFEDPFKEPYQASPMSLQVEVQNVPGRLQILACAPRLSGFQGFLWGTVVGLRVPF